MIPETSGTVAVIHDNGKQHYLPVIAWDDEGDAMIAGTGGNLQTARLQKGSNGSTTCPAPTTSPPSFPPTANWCGCCPKTPTSPSPCSPGDSPAAVTSAPLWPTLTGGSR